MKNCARRVPAQFPGLLYKLGLNGGIERISCTQFQILCTPGGQTRLQDGITPSHMIPTKRKPTESHTSVPLLKAIQYTVD
jgi:hypothetical protein